MAFFVRRLSMLRWVAACFLVAAFPVAGFSQPKEKAKEKDYPLGPDSMEQKDVPQGKWEKYVHASEVFPKTVRDVWIYVPAQYDGKEPACVMVFQDGVRFYAGRKSQFRTPTVFDNLIHKKEMPVTIGIFIDPGSKDLK